jgi:hypothetical protein
MKCEVQTPNAGSGSTGAVAPPRAAYAAANPSDALSVATSAGSSWLLVTDADVTALASGIVPPELQQQATRFLEPLTETLARNAARPERKRKR